MATLNWNRDVEGWTATLSNDVFDDLEIQVTTDGEASPPTARQQKAVAVIESITQANLETVAALVREYAEENLDADELDEMEDEDFVIELHSATVPRLRDSTDSFILFAGNCDVDMEHGVGVICKNATQFAIIHSDRVYDNYDWDSVSELNALL